MAPAPLRGMLNIGFQLMTTTGIFIANLINYSSTCYHHHSWFPFSPRHPNSLIEHGYDEKAKAQLQRICGTTDIKAEFEDLVWLPRVTKPRACNTREEHADDEEG